jgi:hypothetical protein
MANIPGTKAISTSGISTHNSDNALFTFHIEEFKEAEYLNAFIRKLDTWLPSMVFSRRTLAVLKERIKKGLTKISLMDEARALLQKTERQNIHSSGEMGEFLLYIFAKEVVKANKLVSKIQTRGSTGMPIIGRDGIYAYQENGNIYMLVGEAKLRPESNNGLREAQDDINSFWESGKIEHEIQLASSNLVDELSPTNKSIYETYFIKDSENRQRLRFKNVIFIGYNFEAFSDLIAGKVDPDQFNEAVQDDLIRCFNNQREKISACRSPSIYCFLPFESIDDARNEFAKYHNLIIE